MEQRIRELEAESALQAARADAASGTVRALEEQRTTELSNIHEQHREELSAAQSRTFYTNDLNSFKRHVKKAHLCLAIKNINVAPK